MKSYQFDVIGTRWVIEILSAEHFDDSLIAKIHGIIDEFDQRYSRFRDDSLVAQLASEGELCDPPQEFVDMLSFAREMYDVSEGAFSIAVGASLHRMGYGSRVHGHSIRHDIWDNITFSKRRITAPKGEMLDFGGFGKGWLIDRFVTLLRTSRVQEFIVNGGGDLYCQSDAQIEFRLEDPYDTMKQFGQTRITRGALACSSTVKRTWRDGSLRKHHIIDPSTDDSSDSGVVASYVRADTALIADAMATILIIRPDLEATLKEKYQLQTILVKA